jgi:DNA replication protein DnaC
MDDPRWGKLWPCPAPDCSARAEQQAQRAPQLLRKSGLPDKYTQFTFASWLALPDEMRQGKQKAARAVWAWAQGPVVIGGDARPWLVLQGPLGVGKTGLAAAAVNHLISQGQPVVFYRLAELFADIQGRYGKDDPPSADDVLQAIQRAPRLVLDECNVPSASADKQRIFEEIVRYRHGRELLMVITCNVDPQGFATMWGERTADVVAEMSHWITMSGPKLRKGLK